MFLRICGLLTVSALASTAAMAQPPGGGEGRPGGPPRGGQGPGAGGPPEIIRALDADKDGVISAKEIEGAVAALKSLDKNEDGELSREEIGPARGGRFGERGPRDGEAGGRPGEGGGRGGRGNFMTMLDKDKDGKISKEEAPERMKEGFDRLDGNKDGFIDEAEMRAMMERFRAGRPEGAGRPGGPGRPEGAGGPGGRPGGAEAMIERLKQFDKDGDDKISEAEAPERMKENFTKIDTNSDGFIDEAEVKQMLEKARERGPRGPGKEKPDA